MIFVGNFDNTGLQVKCFRYDIC